MGTANPEGLAEALLALERAVERQFESLQELRTALRERAAHLDARFAEAEEVLRSIGRRQGDGT